MVIRLANELLVKTTMEANSSVSPDELTGRLFRQVPMAVLKFKFPGGVHPDFEAEKKAGLTIGEVFGDFTVENVLDKAAEKIQAGQYRIKLKLSKETGIIALGTQALGDKALVAFLMACQESRDERIRNWVAAVIDGAENGDPSSD